MKSSHQRGDSRSNCWVRPAIDNIIANLCADVSLMCKQEHVVPNRLR